MNYPEATPGTVRASFHPKLQELLHALGVDFVEPGMLRRRGIFSSNSCNAALFPGEDVVSVMVVDGWQDHYLAHELIHWAGMAGRAHRPIFDLWCSGYSALVTRGELHTEEATAELGALLLTEALGIRRPGEPQKSAAYLYDYPLADVCRAEQEAKRAFAWIKAQVSEVSNVKSA